MPSGYFSEPKAGLDPNLFSGERMLTDVRWELINVLCDGLESIGFHNPHGWLNAWLAGSGITYQYGNGDLDVLFGVDFPAFLESNPQMPRLSMPEIAAYVDQRLKDTLWPKTSHYNIGDGWYEVTFYWNPTTGRSIDNIHPYAAYDLMENRWVVRPPEVPHNPRDMYPPQWHAITENDFDNAWKIQDLYYGGSPSMRLQGINSARGLWREIHEGRHQAFSDTGAGYGDWHNYRWQRAKETGAADILRNIVADADATDALAAIPASGDIITRAAMRYASPRYYQ